MNVIGASFAISFLMTGLPLAQLPLQLLSKPLGDEKLSLQSAKVIAGSSSNAQAWPALRNFYARVNMQDVLEKECRKVPVGMGIPGFQPGTPKSHVRQMFGAPTRTVSGYWPNTTAVIYDLIPNKVSLGFLFDKDSEYLRQTEASFAESVASNVIHVTLDSMLGCRLNEQIKLGLQLVKQGESSRYFFSVESLKGVIERDERERIYIGIWQADLH